MNRNLCNDCNPYTVVWALMIVIALAFILNGIGCAESGQISTADDSLPNVSTSVEKTGVHVESAERLNAAAKPYAGTRALPLMNQVSKEHAEATLTIADARKEIKSSQREREILQGDNLALAATVTRLTSGWGYKAQLFVERLKWVLLAAVFVHFVGGAVAPFIPGVYGSWIALIARWINPALWFQTARDHVFYEVLQPKRKAAKRS